MSPKPFNHVSVSTEAQWKIIQRWQAQAESEGKSMATWLRDLANRRVQETANARNESNPNREATAPSRSHALEWIGDDDETWKVVCSCGWEAWGFANEHACRSLHALHVGNPEADDPRGLVDDLKPFPRGGI